MGICSLMFIKCRNTLYTDQKFYLLTNLNICTGICMHTNTRNKDTDVFQQYICLILALNCLVKTAPLLWWEGWLWWPTHSYRQHANWEVYWQKWLLNKIVYPHAEKEMNNTDEHHHTHKHYAQDKIAKKMRLDIKYQKNV